VPLTHFGPDPQKTAWDILKQYKMSNAEVLVRQDVTIDEFIDVVLGNRKYIQCLYTYNKIDMITVEEVDQLARNPHSTVVSVEQEFNLDYLLDKMWDYLGLTRIYTKRRGNPPDLVEPVVLSTIRKGTTIRSLCENVSSHMLRDFAFAMVWGVSAKHSPMRCGIAHQLEDQDVVQVMTKTAAQQKNDKNYQALVQSFDDKFKANKKKAQDLKKKKIGKLQR
jgi:ribosome-interacting GTPase 1